MAGIPALRQAISCKVDTLYGFAADQETEVTVTSGATEALFDAVQASVQAGDEVIMFDPAYDSYEPAILMAGGIPVRVPLQLPDYSIDWNRVADSLTSRTRLIIINTPHNPCGVTLAPSDLDALAELIKDTAILVLSDEVYEHMVFDGEQHLSVLSHPLLRERSFAVFSFGKTYHATGWKLAYCIARPALTEEFRKIHQFVTFTTTSFRSTQSPTSCRSAPSTQPSYPPSIRPNGITSARCCRIPVSLQPFKRNLFPTGELQCNQQQG